MSFDHVHELIRQLFHTTLHLMNKEMIKQPQHLQPLPTAVKQTAKLDKIYNYG